LEGQRELPFFFAVATNILVIKNQANKNLEGACKIYVVVIE
jgi:hypothetical protein